MDNHYAIFITARLKSKRLKNKILRKLNDQTIIEYQIRKLKNYFKNYKVILITSKLKSDDKLIEIAKKEKIYYHRGSALDVLKRIYTAAKKFNIKNIISVTADNPLIDLYYLKIGFQKHIKTNKDFSFIKGIPIGTFGYYVKKSTLKDVLKWKKKINTEIWGNFILKKKKYSINRINFSPKYLNKSKSYRFTIDYKQDLDFVNMVLLKSKKKYPDLKELINICNKFPKLLKINNKMKQKSSDIKVY